MSIFEENLSYRPFKYPWAVAAAKRHSIEMHWHEDQIELQDDLRQWNDKKALDLPNVSHETNKFIISRILNLFTEMDVTVGEGYTKLIPHVKNNEIRNLLMTFASREIIHQRAYSLLSESLGTSDAEWKEFRQYKEMQNKLDEMSIGENLDLSDKLSFAKALSKILLGEGIGLFASFAILLNYKRFGLLIGFNTVNEWSLNDETDHVENNIKILKEVRKELLEVENFELNSYIERSVDLYIEAEFKFIDLVYEMGEPQDLTKEQLKEYIRYLGEFRLFQLGLSDISEVRENPLDWMEWLLSATKHGSFFEKRISDYSHSGLLGEIDYNRYKQKENT